MRMQQWRTSGNAARTAFAGAILVRFQFGDGRFHPSSSDPHPSVRGPRAEGHREPAVDEKVDTMTQKRTPIVCSSKLLPENVAANMMSSPIQYSARGTRS
jgi:hypothetical protein